MAETVQKTQQYPSFRWFMLFLLWLSTLTSSWATMLVGSMAKPLMEDLGIKQAALMSAFAAPGILAIFLSIPMGMLADRFGIRKMIFLGGIISALGIALRGFSTSYVQFFALTLLFGMGQDARMPNVGKFIRGWFPPHQIATASGLNATAAGGGFAISLLLSYPLFGYDWRVASWTLGAFGSFVAFLWLLLAREREVSEEGARQVATHGHPATHGGGAAILRGLSRASKIRDVWLCGLITTFNIGGAYIIISQLTHALETARHVAPAAAGAIASIFPFGAAIGGNVITPILSDRVGLRKPFLIIGAMLGSVMLYLTWNLPLGFATGVVAALGGTSLGTLAVVSGTVITEHRRIPYEIQGAARGLTGAVGSGGRYLILVLSGYMSEWWGYTVTFSAAALIVLTALPFTLMLTETGPKAQLKVKPKPA